MKKSIFKVLSLLLVLGLMIGLAGCGGQSTPQEGQGGESTAPKKYIVGTEPTFPPFEYTDEATGEIVGFDIDLIKEIAKEAGIEIEIQAMGFDGLIPALQSGSIDIVMSGMTIDPEREKEVDFGTPYFNAGLSIAVAADNNEINSVEDLKGKVVAVQIGTTGANKANELKEQGIVKEVKTYNGVNEAFMELLNGNVDAVINDLPVNEAYMARNPGKIKMVGEVLEGEQYGFAVASGNKELLDKLNEGLEKVKQSGKFDELKMKYFGS